jgi:hypothetical protein
MGPYLRIMEEVRKPDPKFTNAFLQGAALVRLVVISSSQFDKRGGTYGFFKLAGSAINGAITEPV